MTMNAFVTDMLIRQAMDLAAEALADEHAGSVPGQVNQRASRPPPRYGPAARVPATGLASLEDMLLRVS